LSELCRAFLDFFLAFFRGLSGGSLSLIVRSPYCSRTKCTQTSLGGSECVFFNQKRSFNLISIRIIMNQFVPNARQSPIQTPSYLPFFHSTPYFEQNHYFLNPKPLFLAPMPYFLAPRTYAQPLSTSFFLPPTHSFPHPLSLFSPPKGIKKTTLSLSFFYHSTSLFSTLDHSEINSKPLFLSP